MVCYHFAIKSGIQEPKTQCLCGFTQLLILFPLAPCKSILNTFVYEIYQRVFILFELSVKHTLSDFLLPFRCHTTIWHFNCIGFIILIFRQLYSQILNFLLLDHSLHFLYIHYIFHFGFHLFLGQLLNQYQSF